MVLSHNRHLQSFLQKKKFKTYFANLLKFNTFLPVLHYNGRPRTFWGLSKVKYPGENLSFNNYQKKFHYLRVLKS